MATIPGWNAPATRDQLLQQFDTINASTQRGGMIPGSSFYDQNRKRQEQILAQLNAGSGAAGNDPASQAQRAHDELFGLARGRLSDLRGDSADQMVLNSLMQRSGSDAGPYDKTTVNALLTGASGQARQAERSQMAQLGRGGLSVMDPAYQSAAREIQAQRQIANQQANLGIQQQANLANYAARGQALGQLGGFNQMRNAGITDASRYLGGLLAAEQFTQPEAQPYSGQFYQQQSYQPYRAPQVYAQPQAQPQQTQRVSRPAPQPQQPALGGYSNNPVPTNRLAGPAAPPRGYVQMAGQPQTRVTIPGTYNPYQPVY